MSCEETFIVYAAYIHGEMVYVGQGKIGREKHCNSGTSHSYALNEAHFKGEYIEVNILHEVHSRERALEIEKSYIEELHPRFNIALNTEKAQKLTLKSESTKKYNAIKKYIFEDLRQITLLKDSGVDGNLRQKTIERLTVLFREFPLKMFLDPLGVKCIIINRRKGIIDSTSISYLKRKLYCRWFELVVINGESRLRLRPDIIDLATSGSYWWLEAPSTTDVDLSNAKIKPKHSKFYQSVVQF